MKYFRMRWFDRVKSVIVGHAVAYYLFVTKPLGTLLSITPVGTKLGEALVERQTLSLKKCIFYSITFKHQYVYIASSNAWGPACEVLKYS